MTDLPRRLVSNLLRELKKQHRALKERERLKNKVSVKVLAKEVWLAQDSTHVGSVKGRKAWAEVTKDAATLQAGASGDGKPITGLSMIQQLESLKTSDKLPLVLATDNGPAYKDSRVNEWLKQHQVIHLFSRPHTPQDNGRAERGIGEGKHLAGLGKGVILDSGRQGVQNLNKALQTLNQHWPRASKGGYTANELESRLEHWSCRVSRNEFFQKATAAIDDCRELKGRVLRQAKREAIFRTLESFELILRTRGGLVLSSKLHDSIS